MYTVELSKSLASFSELPANVICFSHLRWDFVYQRPQHLLTRLAQRCNVFYMEEPVLHSSGQNSILVTKRTSNLWTLVPHLYEGIPQEEMQSVLKMLFDQFMVEQAMTDFGFWYYTPMALDFTREYQPSLIIYDCMDELSAFDFAPSALKLREKELLGRADLVFTGGHSLYEAKKNQHENIHPFPSSIEKEHFVKARQYRASASRKPGARPVLGYYGVIDERFDIELIRDLATAKPEWQISLIGPVVKIDPASLPKNKNIKYFGSKTYEQLPACIASWDLALIPFLLNKSTQFISPTKTPEYLAAGLPVISTPIRDVINPYSINNLVEIAGTAKEFAQAAQIELDKSKKAKKMWLKKVDLFLEHLSWDKTIEGMLKLIQDSVSKKTDHSTSKKYG